MRAKTKYLVFARMVIPLTWDEDGITECAFVTRAFYRGKAVDQLQMHLRGDVGLSSHEGGDFVTYSSETYRIVTVFFDHAGNGIEPVGIVPLYDTGCACPTFGIVRPAVTNTLVDMSPYGQSVFADAVDAIQAVDLTFDALINEISLSKMRVFLSDVLFDRSTDGNKTVTIPFGRQDCTVFRKVLSTEDTIQEFAPALRTSSQIDAFSVALQMLGDLRGLVLQCFDVDDSLGYFKNVTEVSSDNSALMRNIRRHENCLDGTIMGCSSSAGMRHFLSWQLNILPLFYLVRFVAFCITTRVTQ